MKRQRRNRNKNRNNNNNNNFNRSMDSQGPDVKVRGNASTIFEKYTSLARDAKMSGNRVKAENLLQHAEHYLRLMNIQEAAKQEAREKADAERAAREEARSSAKETSDEQPYEELPRAQKRRPDDQIEGENASSALDVVTPKSDAPKIKLEKKASKPKTDNDELSASEEKPTRRRKAPGRKSSGDSETIVAAE